MKVVVYSVVPRITEEGAVQGCPVVLGTAKEANARPRSVSIHEITKVRRQWCWAA